MEVDPFGFIEKECHITSSQESTLSTTSFVREEPFFAATDDHTWPQCSDEDDVILPHENAVTITICSAPSSPELERNDGVMADDINSAQNDVGFGVSDELGFYGERKRAREELETTSPPSTTAKESRLCDVELLDDNDDNTKGTQNDVIFEISDELGFSGERKRMRKKSVSPSPPPTTAKKSRLCDGDENTEEIPNDSKSSKLGFAGERETSAEIGGDTEEVNIADEDGGNNHDTEELNDDDNDATREVVEEEESNGNGMECLMQVLKELGESKGTENEGVNVDFLETAKRRGCTFPSPRWLGT